MFSQRAITIWFTEARPFCKSVEAEEECRELWVPTVLGGSRGSLRASLLGSWEGSLCIEGGKPRERQSSSRKEGERERDQERTARVIPRARVEAVCKHVREMMGMQMHVSTSCSNGGGEDEDADGLQQKPPATAWIGGGRAVFANSCCCCCCRCRCRFRCRCCRCCCISAYPKL